MNRKIINVPCSVNTWLYACGERNCVPGLASSVRINNAKMPATTRNPRELTRYRIPIFLWSVVVSQPRRRPPSGSGRATGGAWITANSLLSLLRVSHDEHSRHRRAMHVALEGVLARPQPLDGVAAGAHARELPGGEELVRRVDSVPDGEVVVDPGIEVGDADRDGLARQDREAIRVPRDVLCGDMQLVATRGRTLDPEDRLSLHLDPGEEVGFRYHLDDERHPRVSQAAEFRALSVERSESRRRPGEIVGEPRD